MEQGKPLTVSVITPSYQHRHFLQATLDSILLQAGDFYLDHLVLDGGSTDGTIDLLQEYEGRIAQGAYPIACRGVTFRWSSQRDRGQSHAINMGFQAARGDIIAWLNSDDVYADRLTLAKVTRYFTERPNSQFVFGNGFAIDAGGKILREEYYVTRNRWANIAEIDYIVQPAAFWRREVIDRVGLLNEAMHYAFDWDYWIRCAEHFPLEYLDEFLACNRLHQATKTLRGGIDRKREIAEMLLRYNSFTELAVQFHLATPLPEIQRIQPKTGGSQSPLPAASPDTRKMAVATYPSFSASETPPCHPTWRCVTHPGRSHAVGDLVTDPFPTPAAAWRLHWNRFVRRLLTPTRALERTIRHHWRRRRQQHKTELTSVAR